MSVECFSIRVDNLGFKLNDYVPFLFCILIPFIESKLKVVFFVILMIIVFKNCQVSSLFEPKQTNVKILMSIVFQGNLSHTVCLKVNNLNASLLFREISNNGGFPI